MKYKMVLGACCLCSDDGGIWFVHEKMAILFYYDFGFRKITFYRIIPCKQISIGASFGAMVYKDGKLYLFSNAQRESFIYDIQKDIFTELFIENVCLNAFRGACVWGDYVYAFPYRYDRIIRIEGHRSQVEYLEKWRDILHCDESFYTNSWNQIDEKSIIMAVPQSHQALKYDIASEKWSTIRMGNTTADYTYFACLDGKLYGINRENGTLNMLTMQGEPLKCVKIDYVGAYVHAFQDCIIVDPTNEDFIDIYEKGLDKYKRYHTTYEKSGLRLPYRCLSWLSAHGKFYAFDKANGLICIDEHMNVLRDTGFMDETMYEKLCLEIFETKVSCYEENELFGLEEFLLKHTKT